MTTKEDLKQYHASISLYYDEISKNSLHVYQRIDTLTTVISTSGIFLLATMISSTQSGKYEVWGFYISIVLFAVAVILNLTNHLMSTIAHSKALTIFYKLKADLENGQDINDPLYNKQQKEKEKSILNWNNAIKTINFFAVISLIMGIMFSVLTFLLV